MPETIKPIREQVELRLAFCERECRELDTELWVNGHLMGRAKKAKALAQLDRYQAIAEDCRTELRALDGEFDAYT